MKKVKVVDSHTGGEPTRVIMSGFPLLAGHTMAEKRESLRQQDEWRRAVILEPRGHDVLVGALYCPPESADATCGVIFFNNTGYLGMCGHGTIGLVTTLHYLGLIEPGLHRIDTPVGQVRCQLHDDGSVTLCNIPAYRYRTGVNLEVPGYGPLKGDIAWGGNWFFLTGDHGQRIAFDNVAQLTTFCTAIRFAIDASGLSGENGGTIDHIELFAPTDGADSRNFVLCPGGAYDRSPCGTGTSAKLACLAADGKLKEGQCWHQASITGSVFEGHFIQQDGCITPYIKGRAWLTADSELLIDESDPFDFGIEQPWVMSSDSMASAISLP
ncbi:4-hydroxyproline epimerase [Carnimonas bestiolae]|uniref:4-hydroxyproline epimerase n=1 Tax=Carnimonas bestiolae TaxID=3402172 RepID=UPI003EDB869F